MLWTGSNLILNYRIAFTPSAIKIISEVDFQVSAVESVLVEESQDLEVEPLDLDLDKMFSLLHLIQP